MSFLIFQIITCCPTTNASLISTTKQPMSHRQQNVLPTGLPSCLLTVSSWSVSKHTEESTVCSAAGQSVRHSGHLCSDTGCRSGSAGDPDVLPPSLPDVHGSGG